MCEYGFIKEDIIKEFVNFIERIKKGNIKSSILKWVI